MINYVVFSGTPEIVRNRFEKARKELSDSLTFVPAWQEEYIAGHGKWAYVVWGNEKDERPNRVARGPADFCVVNGPILGVGEEMDRTKLASLALEGLATKPPDDVYRSLSGVYNLVAVTQKNQLIAFSDFTGAYPNYYTQVNLGWRGGLVMVSNRCTLLADLRNDAYRYDLNALGWLVGHASVFGDNTPYNKIRRILNEEYLTAPIGEWKIRLSRFAESIWPTLESEGSLEDLTDAEWDEIVERLVFNVRSSMAYLACPRSSLTGGKDSRLVLALSIDAYGKDAVETFTNGTADSPELLCAQHIARALGIKHVANVAKHVSEVVDYDLCWRKLRMHAFRYEGFICPWDGATAGVLKGVSNQMTGFGGELYRGPGGEAKQFKTLKYLEQRDRIHEIFYNFHQRIDPLGVQTKYMRRYQMDYFDDWLDWNMAHVRYDALPEKCFVENRITNWNGPLAQNPLGRVKLMPLFSKDAARLYFKLNAQARSRELLHFTVIRKLCPQLVELPFLKQTWDAKLLTPAMAKPFESAQAGRYVQSWQREFVMGQKRQIVDLLLEACRKTDIEYIFDVKKTCAALMSFKEPDVVSIKVILSAIGIAHTLLNRGERCMDT